MSRATKIDELKEQYDNLFDDVIILKTNGNLSRLCQLSDLTDPAFDQFFDSLRIADEENDEIESRLNKEEQDKYIEFLETLINKLQQEKDNIEAEQRRYKDLYKEKKLR